MAGGRRRPVRVGAGLGALLCALLKYCFPSSGRGFADEAIVSYKTFPAPVVSVLLHSRLYVTVDVQAACRVTTVTQELLKEGFHRDLLVKVELGEDAGGCAVAAQVHLPPGLYVDPYELATLQQHNLTKAVLFPDAIDVEAPEYLAQAVVLLLFLEPEARCSRCFRGTVPVHARYHRPARDTHQALVALQSPQVLLCCCHGHLSAECWEPAEVDTPCSSDTTGSCQWHTTKHRPAYEESMLRVPVGLREHSSLVCALTLLTTGLCSGLILAAACKYGHFSQ